MWPQLRMCSCLEELWKPEDFSFLLRSPMLVTGKGGPQNWQVTPDPAIGRPALEAEILFPALPPRSLCRQLSGSLERVHGQGCSSFSKRTVNTHLVKTPCWAPGLLQRWPRPGPPSWGYTLMG